MPSLNSPLLKPAPIPLGFVSLSPRVIAPVQSKAEEYCWVYHPSYGFYFIQGTENYHYRFFKGDGKGNSRTEVIPNKLYDDCNRGYAFVDRNKRTVQIQTAGLVKDYLDFVPQQVVAGFKKAFPRYDVYVKGGHIASGKVAEWDEAYETQVCDAQSEAASNIIHEYKQHVRDKGYHQDWDLVPLPRLKKIWEDYMKTGFVRDEAGLNQIAEILVYNVAAIQVNTILCGHTGQSPEQYAEDEVGGNFPEGYFELNDTFFDDEKGAWRISDYAMDKLTHLACEIRRTTKAEQKLQVIDRLLNVVHQRSDLAGWFVQGGSRALSQLSQTISLPEPEPKKKAKPADPRQRKLPFTSSLLKKRATEYACSDCGHKQTHNEVCDECGNCCGFKKIALDALLEMIGDEDYATHQHHSDPDFTTQNGKMMEKGTEVEQGALNDVIPGRFLASKKASAVLPAGYEPNPTLTDAVFKWIWSPRTGAVVFNDKTMNLKRPGKPQPAALCTHADVVYLNHLKFDDTPKGFIEAYPGRRAFRVRTTGGFGNIAESNAMDAVAEEFRDMYGLKDWTIEIPPNYGYKGIYRKPRVEDENGEMTKEATVKCAACESGDCLAHQATVGAMPIKILTDRVVPGVDSEPTVEDAAFFKESDEFEVSRNASGEVVIAATQSYGAGTPPGGTSNVPPPPTQQVQPTPLTTAPPQQVQQKQPAQPQQPPTPPTPPPPGSATQQQEATTSQQQLLGQVLSSAKSFFSESFKTALVGIHETPKFLPPRDDMRRHIDETAKAEVMEGVHTPADPPPAAAHPQPPVQQQRTPMTNRQELQQRALASDKTAYTEEDDDDDDGLDGAYGTMYGKPLETSNAVETHRGDVELLEAAPEFPEEAPSSPKKRFRTTDKDKKWLQEMGIKASKVAIQIEEGVHQICPNCHGQEVKNVEDSPPEDGIVECVDCGCFFSL